MTQPETLQPDATPSRALPIGGAFNARDIGGYDTPAGPIAWRRLMRSGGLDAIDDADRAVLAELGVRTVLDLRRDEELETRPNQLGELNVRTIRVSITPGSLTSEPDAMPTLTDIYTAIVESSGPALAEAINVLAEPAALPAWVHCTAGKDRTGVVVALVLALVGVDDQVIIEDYAVSEALLGTAFVERLSAGNPDIAEIASDLLASPPALIASVLEQIRASHGGVAEFLVHHGMDPAAPDRLRAALVEP